MKVWPMSRSRLSVGWIWTSLPRITMMRKCSQFCCCYPSQWKYWKLQYIVASVYMLSTEDSNFHVVLKLIFEHPIAFCIYNYVIAYYLLKIAVWMKIKYSYTANAAMQLFHCMVSTEDSNIICILWIIDNISESTTLTSVMHHFSLLSTKDKWSKFEIEILVLWYNNI